MFDTATQGDFLATDEVGSKPDFPCHVCGSRSYSWGTLAAQSINFTADDASILAKALRFGWNLRARRCDHCGNVQMFAPIPQVKES
jgi:hypothetical protein